MDPGKKLFFFFLLKQKEKLIKALGFWAGRVRLLSAGYSQPTFHASIGG